MKKSQTSAPPNKTQPQLLVLAIYQGGFSRGIHECIYGAVQLSPAKIKFLCKLTESSIKLGDAGHCKQPVAIEARDWLFSWDKEPCMKIEATYWRVSGSNLQAVCYTRKGKYIGRTVDLDIREFSHFAETPIIWHDDNNSNSCTEAKYSHSFAEESLQRLKNDGFIFPESIQARSFSQERSMMLDILK